MSTKLIIRENGRQTGSYDLDSFHKSEVVLGRNDSCDIVIHNGFVSGTHAVFQKTGSGWSVRDNKSTNGLYYKGEKISRKDIFSNLKLEIRAKNGDQKYLAELLFKVVEDVEKGPEPVKVVNQIHEQEIEQLTVAEESELVQMHNSKTDNFLRGEGIKEEDVILTNKRLIYEYKKGLLNSRIGRDIVDVREVTGVKVEKTNKWWALIFGGLFLLLGIIFCLIKSPRIYGHDDFSIVTYLYDFSNYYVLNILGRHLIFWGIVLLLVFLFTYGRRVKVEYPGGVVSLTLKKYSYEEVLDLQNTIFEAKRQGLLGNYKVRIR